MNWNTVKELNIYLPAYFYAENICYLYCDCGMIVVEKKKKLEQIMAI